MASKLIDPKTVELKHDDDAASAAAPATATNNIPLIHVFNPFHYPKLSSFSPLDYEQWSMLASVRRAKENFIQHQLVLGEGDQTNSPQHAFDEVIVICAILETDEEALLTVLSPYCDRIVHLRRNAASEYPDLDLKPLPFVQDIINVGMEVAKEIVQEREYYLMLTNSDICLTEHFYTHLNEHEIPSTNTKALTINRMTIPNINIPEIAEGASIEVVHDAAMNLLDQAKQVYEANKFTYHPGIDCFIAHSSIWDMVQFGDMFLGYPPFDWHIKLAFEIMEPTYQDVKSNVHGTFHLGDERSWAHAHKEEITSEFGPKEVVLDSLKQCPRMFNPAIERHTVQNGINCGELFSLPQQQQGDDGNTALAPQFVRPGYEEVYLQAFSRKGKHVGDYKNAFPPCLRGPKNPHRCSVPSHYLLRGGGGGGRRAGPYRAGMARQQYVARPGAVPALRGG